MGDQLEGSRTRNHADERSLHESDRPIPSNIDREAAAVALKPLLDLLNVTDAELYDLHIDAEEITFTVVAPEASIPSTTRYGEDRELGVFCAVRLT